MLFNITVMGLWSFEVAPQSPTGSESGDGWNFCRLWRATALRESNVKHTFNSARYIEKMLRYTWVNLTVLDRRQFVFFVFSGTLRVWSRCCTLIEFTIPKISNMFHSKMLLVCWGPLRQKQKESAPVFSPNCCVPYHKWQWTFPYVQSWSFHCHIWFPDATPYHHGFAHVQMTNWGQTFGVSEHVKKKNTPPKKNMFMVKHDDRLLSFRVFPYIPLNVHKKPILAAKKNLPREHVHLEELAQFPGATWHSERSLVLAEGFTRPIISGRKNYSFLWKYPWNQSI